VPAFLKALGREGLPPRLRVWDSRPRLSCEYRLAQTFKHDFFAATGLYAGLAPAADKLVLKVGRRTDLLGLPLAWLGRWLIGREAALYERFSDLSGVPRFAGRWGRDGFLHVFVEGHPLGKGERVPEQFFPQLQDLLGQVHARQAAYVDLEKRENIIVGDDGRPYLIDFQISWRRPPTWLGRSRPARWLLRRLQESDRYHLMKHWRRHRPDQLDSAGLARSRAVPAYIRLHRAVARPFTRLRRRTLARLDPSRAVPGTVVGNGTPDAPLERKVVRSC